MRRAWMAVAILLAAAALPCAAQSEDERWIEDFMTGRVAADYNHVDGQHAWPRESIEFIDLPRFVGATVRIGIGNGRTRFGVVERADARQVVIKTRMGGGWASYTLPADQVLSIELVSS